ncbi:MAG: hypothetical protein ACTII7_02400 [Galactobacter sp.]
MKSFYWFAWPFAAWGMPLLGLCILFGVGGWNAFTALMFSPLWLPALAFVAWLPRIPLDAKGYRKATPSPVIALMTTHWTALLLVAMGGDDYDDADRLASPLESAAVGLTAIQSEWAVQAAGWTAAASLAVALGWALITPSNLAERTDDDEETAAGSAGLSSIQWGPVVAFLLPIVAIPFAVIGMAGAVA